MGKPKDEAKRVIKLGDLKDDEKVYYRIKNPKGVLMKIKREDENYNSKKSKTDAEEDNFKKYQLEDDYYS